MTRVRVRGCVVIRERAPPSPTPEQAGHGVIEWGSAALPPHPLSIPPHTRVQVCGFACCYHIAADDKRPHDIRRSCASRRRRRESEKTEACNYCGFQSFPTTIDWSRKGIRERDEGTGWVSLFSGA